MRTVLVMLDVKIVKYQHYLALCWHNDLIPLVFIVAVISRIVGRNNGADDIPENLLVRT